MAPRTVSPKNQKSRRPGRRPDAADLLMAQRRAVAHESGSNPEPVPAPGTAPAPTGTATHLTTLLFRGLLLVAAAVAAAFTVAAFLDQTPAPIVDPASPDAPPPDVLVQPDR